MRFVDAEVINPFKLLVDLHDHAVARTAARGRNDALAELALSAVVVSWWTRWQPTMIHAALRAGAGLADIAEATGLEVGEVVRRWRRWTDVQTRLDIGGRPALDPTEVRAIAQRLDSGVDR
ncbi:hypothetical protein [Micromonospora thermarum]|uniref:Uncharacterized protein n=1 Tax=Micromonospora thermarum TaxID=2720024 RepID=A0ABX0Z4U7_9ACTN|nr:hypothetical protein [Micromonospora thermarum]NJP32861.1 hypothetical protein [Micromonospora thermarum]